MVSSTTMHSLGIPTLFAGWSQKINSVTSAVTFLLLTLTLKNQRQVYVLFLHCVTRLIGLNWISNVWLESAWLICFSIEVYQSNLLASGRLATSSLHVAVAFSSDSANSKWVYIHWNSVTFSTKRQVIATKFRRCDWLWTTLLQGWRLCVMHF